MRRAKALLRSFFRPFGLEVFSRWEINEIGLALYLKQLFAHQKVDCVFDVGANRGQFAQMLRERVGYEGLIVSFEPAQQAFCELKRRANGDDRWLIRQIALGRLAGNKALHIAPSSVFSSFLELIEESGVELREAEAPESEDVEIQTLDREYLEVKAQFAFRNPYLKLDTQGYDLEVAAGGASVMSQFVALQTEASVRPIYRGMPDWRTSILYFEERGFSLGGMFPVALDSRLRLMEFDCVFVNVHAQLAT